MTRLFEAKPFLIAEVGSNWHTLEHCLTSIAMAKNAGADACKFQAFTYEALYGMTTKDAALAAIDRRAPGKYDTEGPAMQQHVARLVSIEKPGTLPLEWLPALKQQADFYKIELMCTAFSPELVAAVDPFVSVHKVASSDLSYPQLLEAVAKTGKPMLLSTGASSKGDINLAIRELAAWGSGPVALLYCVAAYPALSADLRVMDLLYDAFDGKYASNGNGYYIGFSDHTPGIYMAIEAARKGAVVIEKHFTAFPELDTPDRPHSLTTDEFQLMCDHIRGKRRPVIGPTKEERDMVLRHNRRLIATSDILAGSTLQYGVNFGAFRSLEDDGHGLSPFAWESVQGKKATKAIARGKGVGPGDFG